jgi:transposase-like protein
VEVIRRYSNRADQEQRLRNLLDIVPAESEIPKPRTPKRICKTLTESQIEAIVQGYLKGDRYKDLAATLGINEWTVQKYVRLNNLPRRSPLLDPEQIQQIVTMYQGGHSLMALSKKFSVATDTVARALRKAGVQLRQRRGWNPRAPRASCPGLPLS